MTNTDYTIMAFLLLMLLFLSVTWIAYLGHTLRVREKKNRTCIAKATVIGKQENVQDLLEGDLRTPCTGNTYYLTFDIQEQGVVKFMVHKEQYQKCEEGQAGKIEYSGNRFCRFFDME